MGGKGSSTIDGGRQTTGFSIVHGLRAIVNYFFGKEEVI
jgi:hypothetical protein